MVEKTFEFRKQYLKDRFRNIFFYMFCFIFAFILYNGLTLYSNFNNIKFFNNKYKKYIYNVGSNFNYIDYNVIDPNDSETNILNKWRCKNYNGKYVGLNGNGFYSISGFSIDKTYDFIEQCIEDIFSIYIKKIYNPCVVETSSDCQTLKNLLK